MTLKGRWRAQERPHVPLELLRASGSQEMGGGAMRRRGGVFWRGRPLQVGEPVELWPGANKSTERRLPHGHGGTAWQRSRSDGWLLAEVEGLEARS